MLQYVVHNVKQRVQHFLTCPFGPREAAHYESSPAVSLTDRPPISNTEHALCSQIAYPGD